MALAFLVLLAGCVHRPPASPLLVREQPHMGTLVTISVADAPAETAQPAIDEAFAEFDRLEALMSEWRPESPLSEVNRQAGVAPVHVDPELLAVIERSLAFAAATDGAFDPTFASLWGLWTFGDDGVRHTPDPAEVEARRPLVDWHRVHVDPVAGTVYLDLPGMKIGLGGIAKGWATDKAVAILRRHGLSHFAVQAGGELYVAGTRDRRPWRVGVRDPRGEGPFAAIDLSDAAFDTSGDYERYFIENGVRYHHVIDPATLYPATASRSATVLAADATTADGLDNALFVLGPERGQEILRAFPGVEAVWVTADNEVVTTPGLADRLWVMHPPSP